MSKVEPIFNKSKAKMELDALKLYNAALESCVHTLLQYPKYKATSECVSVLQTHNILILNEIERYKRILEAQNERVDEV